MTRERRARLLTVAILAAVMGGIALYRSGWKPPAAALRTVAPPSDPDPRDAVYAMLDAARAGDSAKYLAAFTGQMETALKQSIAEAGEDAFSRYLKESNAAVKGVAILEPQRISERETRLRVEYVYQDRNEVQQVWVEKTPAGWRIARVDSAERVKTLIPYGTPVE